MKIGINTLQIARNYGAVLQAYALKTYLEAMGHCVYMLNTRYQAKTLYKPKSFFYASIKEKILYLKYFFNSFLPHYLPIFLRERNFDNFRRCYLDTAQLDFYDVIIYGSDQIWSKWRNIGFDPFFWGWHHTANRKIAFSASMGMLDIENADEKFIKDSLSHFSAISVREVDLQKELIKRNLAPHLHIEHTIDPIFLLPKSYWEAFAPHRIIREHYLLFYDFQIDEQTTIIAQTIAKQRHLRIVRLTDGIVSDGFDKYYRRTAGPREFLSLMKYADFVVSSSFHGTAFSVLLQKQFYVRQVWNKQRVKSLLEICHLENRFIDGVSQVSFEALIDYSKVVPYLESEIHRTQMFLQNAIY